MDVDDRVVLDGRYEIGRVIGRGGMSVVHRAYDRRLDRAVAVKCFDRSAWATPDGRARFQTEARLAASMSHPDIVRVYDAGFFGDRPYLVMECLTGRTLADDLSHGPLPVARVEEVARRVLHALDAAHTRGVLHRDVKPGNVLFAADGAAKLADFGIATSADRTTTLTEAGTVIGTAQYLAPERLEGARATVRSDLYSVGVLGYEALTGKRPFSGDTPVAVAYAIQHAPVRPIRTLNAEVPPRLAATMTRAMARHADDRFGSANEMLGALDHAPTRVLPVVRPTHARPRRRPRALLFGSIAALALLIAALAATHHAPKHEPRQTVSTGTTPTLPAPLQAPFDELQQAVGK
jgi:serine/threonine-protein kinase